MDRSKPTIVDLWTALRQFTPARIALGRAGAGMPTAEVLAFGLAHAQARDAVHHALDVGKLETDLHDAGFAAARVHSAARDRREYLLRPDLGRRLDADAAARLPALCTGAIDVCVIVADGLSSFAAQRHATPLLQALRERAPAAWFEPPVVIAEQGRVALGDEIGHALDARLVAILIGERPGLSSPDSLGVYLTYAPRPGRTDNERNCVSNIRPEGLAYPDAARRIIWLMETALQRKLTGVALKDESDARRMEID